MGWRDIKASARNVVHSTFADAALYFAPGSLSGTDVTVRHHTRTEVFGDLDREGYAQQIEDINRIVIDTEEVTAVPKGRVVLPSGDELFLEVMERMDDSRYQVWNVIRKTVRGGA